MRRRGLVYGVKILALLFLVLSSPLSSLLITIIPSAPQIPMVYASPGQAWLWIGDELAGIPLSYRADVGEFFNITLWTYENDIPDFGLYAWETKLSWNASLLNFSRVFEGSFLKSVGSTIFQNFTYQDESGLDYILVNCTLDGAANGADYFGDLAVIEFKVEGTGGTPLELYETKLFDSSHSPINHKIYAQGYFVNITFICVTPVENVCDPLPPFDTFDVSIWIEEVATLNAWSLKLKWQPAQLLETINVQDGDFFEAQYPGQHFFLPTPNNPAGYVEIVDLLNEGSVSGSGFLATVTFKVKDGGNSTLALTEVELLDPDFVSMTFAKKDAYFRTNVPFVSFTFEPSAYVPAVNQTVTFNATASYDPDVGNLTKYEWAFNDGNITSVEGTPNDPPSPFIEHKYNKTGTYYVNLTVTDDEGQSWTKTFVPVSICIRDVAITEVKVSPTGILKHGTKVNINATIENKLSAAEGATAEKIDLTFYINNTVIETLTFTLEPYTPGRPGLNVKWRNSTWDTSGVALGTYNITVWAKTAPGDRNETNNSFYWGTVGVAEITKAIFPVQIFEATFPVAVETTSSLLPSPGLAFSHKNKQIRLNVTGSEGMQHYLNITIPQNLLNATPSDNWRVTLNVTQWIYSLTTNTTHSFIYFEYTFSSTYYINITGTWVNQPPQTIYGNNATMCGSLYAIAKWQKLALNATDSYDPDDPAKTSTLTYFWDIRIVIPGTGEVKKIWNLTTANPFTTILLNETAINYPYTITLTVTDKDGLKNSTSKSVYVKENAHDLALDVVRLPPGREIAKGTAVTVTLYIKNFGIHAETFDVYLSYDNTAIGSKTGVTVEAQADASFKQIEVTFGWNTDQLPEGEYLLNAVVNVAEDEKPANNQWSGLVLIAIPTKITRVFIQPPEIIDATAVEGTEFTVVVNVSSLGNPQQMAPLHSIFAWEVSVKWNTSILEQTSVEEGEFLKQVAQSFGLETTWAEPEINQDQGYLVIGCTIKGTIATNDPAYRQWVEALFGNGTLATVRFRVKGKGESALDLYGTKLRNPELGVVDHDVEDGVFRNLAKVSIDPASIIDSSLLPGSSIDVNVTISDIKDLYSWEVKVSWNPLVLNLTEVNEGAFLAGQPEGTSFVIKEANLTEGYIIIGCSTVGAHPGVSGSGILANATFSVVGKGESAIDLSNAKLLDSASNQMEHGVSDGYFRNVILPKAIFTYAPSYPDVNTTVVLDASESNDPKAGGYIVKYFFDFDDGISVTGVPNYDSDGNLINCTWVFNNGNTIVTTTIVIQYKYSFAGTYQVKLEVTDNLGLVGSIRKEIAINKLGSSLTLEINPTTITMGEKATLSGSLTPAHPGTLITLQYKTPGGKWLLLNTVTTDQTGKYSYQWTPSEPADFRVKASWEGDVNIYANASQIAGLLVEGIHDISITNATLSTTRVLIGRPVNVSATLVNKGHFTEYFNVTLYYGDAVAEFAMNTTLASGANTTLNFSWNTSSVVEGTYNLKIKVSLTDDANPGDNEFLVGEVTVKVPKPPVASFTITPQNPLVGQAIVFNATGSSEEDGQIVGYFWDFDDGTNETNAIPLAMHSYTVAGTYTVSLAVTDDDGLVSTTTATITVKEPTDTSPILYIAAGIAVAVIVIAILILLKKTGRKIL